MLTASLVFHLEPDVSIITAFIFKKMPINHNLYSDSRRGEMSPLNQKAGSGSDENKLLSSRSLATWGARQKAQVRTGITQTAMEGHTLI